MSLRFVIAGYAKRYETALANVQRHVSLIHNSHLIEKTHNSAEFLKAPVRADQDIRREYGYTIRDGR